MALLFLITFIALSHFIYIKNRDNIKDIPLILKLNGILAFLMLAFFLIYAEEEYRNGEEENFFASFYLLFFTYLITFLVYLSKYIKIFNESDIPKNITNNKGKIENRVNEYYLLFICAISGFSFYITGKEGIVGSFFDLIIFCSTLYIIAQKYLLKSTK